MNTAETMRNNDRGRISLLLSDQARESIAEFAKAYGSYKYDVIEVLALLSDPNDPAFRQKIIDNIDILPESFQKWYAMDQFYQNRARGGKQKLQGGQSE
jgi:hypothetical protein